MAKPKLSPGTLIIQRAMDPASNNWSPYVKIGISKDLPPRDIVAGSSEKILTIYLVCQQHILMKLN